MAVMRLAPDDPRHGTTNGYGNLKCRCRPCRDAWNAKQYEYMERNPDQRRKTRDRGRKARGRSSSQAFRLERRYESDREAT